MIITMQKLMQKCEAEKLWLNSFTDSVDVNLRKLWAIVRDREAWRVAVHGVAESQTRFSD